MAEFYYEAVFGEVLKSGAIEAKNIKEARSRLMETASYIISIKQTGILGFLNNDTSFSFKKIKKTELSAFFQQLGMMLETGISISEALTSLARYGVGNSAVLAGRLHLEVTQGVDFAEAMYAQREFIGKDYSPLIAVGIGTGQLAGILEKISRNLAKADSMQKKISEAVRTPLLNIALAIIVGIYMFTAVVPQMVDSVVDMLNGEVPLLTKIVIGISNALKAYGVFLLILLIGGSIAFAFLTRSIFKPQWEYFKTVCPLFGKVITANNIATFFNSLSIAFLAGMDTGTATRNAAQSVSNGYIRKKLEKAAKEIEDTGALLATALEPLPMINRYDLQALYSGQKTGNMSRMSEYCSQRLEAENNEMLQKLVEASGILATAVSGVIIGVIMFAMYSPMISMMTSMQ